ncbi:FkbM family methyltransferase [Pseudotabrizicola sp. L79]|uniref:FkbM family methyltransferase n=1 Tax=Pseudotabrizicola sp. L79 TaxID=3118402 RepID=UPI002F941208
MSVDQALKRLPAHSRFLGESLPLGRKLRILDVGANPANVPPYAALRDADLAEIHGFEPGADAYAKLQSGARRNEIYHPKAVAAGGKATFYLTANGSFASLFKPDPGQIAALGHWAPATEVVAEIPLTTSALDALSDLPKPDMVKIDAQGSELDILSGGSNTLSDAVAVMPELRFFRLYADEPMMGDVDLHLRSRGFMLHKILPGAVVRLSSSRMGQLRPAMMRNQMVDADAIYIRDIARPDLISVPQWTCLALLADMVFDSLDLVLRCLDHLVERGAIDEAILDEYIRLLPANYHARA